MTKSDCLDYRRKGFGERNGLELKLCVHLLLLNVGDVSAGFMLFSLCTRQIIFFFFFIVTMPKSKVCSRGNGKNNVKRK